jgi:hypothetical protein
MTQQRVWHRGGCHCGQVQFEVEAASSIDAVDCNCSVCARSGYLHLIVPKSRFRLLQGENNLTEYTWGSGVAKHYFCRTCGIKSFYVPRSNPDGIDVNVRCLDRSSIDSVKVTPFNGRDDWDAEAGGLAHLSND